jgi:hypothetical protein
MPQGMAKDVIFVAQLLSNKNRISARFPNQITKFGCNRLTRLEATVNPPTHNP